MDWFRVNDENIDGIVDYILEKLGAGTSKEKKEGGAFTDFTECTNLGGKAERKEGTAQVSATFETV